MNKPSFVSSHSLIYISRLDSGPKSTCKGFGHWSTFIWVSICWLICWTLHILLAIFCERDSNHFNSSTSLLEFIYLHELFLLSQKKICPLPRFILQTSHSISTWSTNVSGGPVGFLEIFQSTKKILRQKSLSYFG